MQYAASLSSESAILRSESEADSDTAGKVELQLQSNDNTQESFTHKMNWKETSEKNTALDYLTMLLSVIFPTRRPWLLFTIVEVPSVHHVRRPNLSAKLQTAPQMSPHAPSPPLFLMSRSHCHSQGK